MQVGRQSSHLKTDALRPAAIRVFFSVVGRNTFLTSWKLQGLLRKLRWYKAIIVTIVGGGEGGARMSDFLTDRRQACIGTCFGGKNKVLDGVSTRVEMLRDGKWGPKISRMRILNIV